MCAELALADYFSFLFSCFFAHYLPFLSFLLPSHMRRGRACAHSQTNSLSKAGRGGILGDIGFSLVLEDGAEEDEAR